MFKITFNNIKLQIEQHNLQELLQAQGYLQPFYAIAINRQFIPRAQYATTKLQENDVIEVVLPMQGG